MTKKTKDIRTEADAPLDLEKSLAELDKIVTQMESGEVSLDESLQLFERGVALTRQCQAALRTAEQKVEILLRKTEGYEPVPFEDNEASDTDADS